MSCPFEVEVLLLRDAGGSPARRIVVEAHLARCESCARIDETLELLGERLRAADEAPLGVVERVVFPARRRTWPVAAAAVAAAVWLAWPAQPQPPRSPVETAEVPSLPPDPLTLPPPTARGPALSALLAALDPAAEEYGAHVAAIAARVRADGAAGSAALAALLAEDPSRAVDVAVLAPSPALAEPLAALLDEPAFAARAVRGLGAARSWRVLVAALDGPAAREALEALVSIGGREVAAELERRADDPAMLEALARVDPARAARACAMGGAWGAVAAHRERIVPELRRLLADDRCAAGAAARLGEAGDKASTDDLIRLAGRPTAARAATGALLSLGAFEAAFRAALRLDEARAAFDGASQAEPFLLDRIGRGPYAGRRAALELLGRCGGVTTVRRLASKPVPRNLVDAAAATLGAIGGEEAIAALDRLGDDRALRRDVVRALGATGDPRALPALRKFLGDGLAGELSRALARIHDPESAGMLADLALRGSGSEEAARALAGMPADVVVPVLLERLGGPGRARDLLVRIAGADHGPRRESWKEWWDSRP